LEQLVAEAKQLGLKAVSVAGDARQEETARRTVEEAVKAFGRIDILVNNIGVGNYKSLVDTSAEEYAEMMDANMRSTFLFQSACRARDDRTALGACVDDLVYGGRVWVRWRGD
jgi:NAD(P)-dependent dehydrogenase (short-subunit alcohol dehydrogenase family)